MLKRAYEYLAIFIFFITVSSFSIYYLVNKPVQKQSALEARTLISFPKATFKSYLSGEFQDNFEKAFSDQVPKRAGFLLATSAFNRLLSQLSYVFSPTGYPLAKAADSPYLYTYKGTQIIIPPPSRFYKNINDGIKKELKSYNSVIEHLPNTRFFSYVIEPMYNAAINPLNKYFENPVNGQYLKTFYDNLPKGMNVASLVSQNMDDYIRYFYKTDHHWNGNGSLKAYKDIYSMLSQGISDFSPMLKINGVTQVKQAPFRGSLARRGIYTNLIDYISDIDTEKFSLQTTINGKPGERSKKAQILSSSFKPELFQNMYADYYGYDFALVDYTNNAAPDRRLLIIGPSYTQAIEQLLASHYRETFVIDLRHYKNYAGEQLKLESYIKEHKIDDVLLMIEPQLISDPNWQPVKN